MRWSATASTSSPRLDDGNRLLLHLGMTGQLFGAGVSSVRLLSSTAGASLTPERQAAGFAPDAHTHLQLRFADGGPDVFFRDVRKFGKVQLLRRGETSPRLERLGEDALRVRAVALREATRHRRSPIKVVLLDQSVLAGVGNIYADEALFLAGIRPLRRAARLSLEDWRTLVTRAAARAAPLHRHRRLLDQRLRAPRWNGRRLPGRAARLWPHRRAVPSLRDADPPHRGRRPLLALLSALPALE